MRQLLALAIAVCYAGTASAQSLGKSSPAPAETSGIVQTLPSAEPEGIVASGVVVKPAQQQQPATQTQPKKSFWKSPWLWVAIGAAAVVIAVAASGGYSSDSGGSGGRYP